MNKQIKTYNGKINCFCCYYNDEINKVMVDLNISFTMGAVDWALEVTPELFKKLEIYKIDQLKGLKIRVKIQDGLLRRIGHWQESKWLFCSKFTGE